MPLDADRVEAIFFDYGSTLIEFSQKQIVACDQALRDVLEKHFGPLDYPKLQERRNADRLAPYDDGFHENNLREISIAMVRYLFGTDPSPEALEDILQVRFDSFVEAIKEPEGVADFLKKLRSRYKVALVSNYPDGEAIRASVARTGLADCFDAVVASGDVQRVKPHPAPFERAMSEVGVSPEAVVHVGDNWLADIQGAKRLGMQAAFTVQYQTPEHFEPQPGDFEPDLRIDHLFDLAAAL